MIRPGRAVVAFLVFLLLIGAWLVTHPADDAAPYSHLLHPVAHPVPTANVPSSDGSRPASSAPSP